MSFAWLPVPVNDRAKKIADEVIWFAPATGICRRFVGRAETKVQTRRVFKLAAIRSLTVEVHAFTIEAENEVPRNSEPLHCIRRQNDIENTSNNAIHIRILRMKYNFRGGNALADQDINFFVV